MNQESQQYQVEGEENECRRQGQQQKSDEGEIPTTTPSRISSTNRPPSVLVTTHRMPRQWLRDRVYGKSRIDPDEKPPFRLCTVPPPVIWCPDILEQNLCCERCGRMGCIGEQHRFARRALMWTALVSNIVGLTFMFLSALAISDDFDILWNFSFTRVFLNVIKSPVGFNEPAMYKVGLRAIAWQSYRFDRSGIMRFRDLCDAVDGSLADLDVVGAFLYAQEREASFDCDACEKTSRRIIPSLFLSMLSYIPNFTTDVLRMWTNYDVNCQKFLATTFSWVSLSTAIYTWVNYRNKCFDSLNTDPFAFDENYEPVDDIDSPDAYVVVEFDWEAGFAQICLAAAALLKIVDIACNFLIQTPTITRDFVEQEEYERSFGTPATEAGSPRIMG